jgi:hypothetical protein
MKFKTLILSGEDCSIITIPEIELLRIDKNMKNNSISLCELRTRGKFKGSAIYFNSTDFNWTFGLDNEDQLIGVPIKNKK